MGGRSDPRFDYVVVPGMTLGLVLSCIAVALSIAQFAIQLQNNEGTVLGTKVVYDNQTTHVEAPVMTLCGPIPFNETATRCLFYAEGLRPVQRSLEADSNGDHLFDYGDDIEIHKKKYNLSWCWEKKEGKEDPLLFHKVYVYQKDKDLLGPDQSKPKDVYFCATFSKDLIPSYLGDGVGKRTFFKLQYTSEFDYEAYILKLWDPVEVRTPRQAVQNLLGDSLKLFSGKTLILPYSVPGTALFSTWVAPFDGPQIVQNGNHDVLGQEVPEYGIPYKGSPRYGPVAVRAGISAVIKLQEEGTQSLEQEAPVFYYYMTLDSLTPEVQYPYVDTSYLVSIAFKWDSDETFYYQNVLQITNVGMAALLITSITGLIVAVADGTAIYLDYEERNQKS